MCNESGYSCYRPQHAAISGYIVCYTNVQVCQVANFTHDTFTYLNAYTYNLDMCLYSNIDPCQETHNVLLTVCQPGCLFTIMRWTFKSKVCTIQLTLF